MEKKWTREKLIHELKWLASQKSKLLSMNIFELYFNLDEPIQDIFGSWDKAAEEANIDPKIFEKVRQAVSQVWVPKVTDKEKEWKKEEIIDTIRTLGSLQDSLPTNTILKIVTTVEEPAKKVFGSWQEALDAAGVSKDDLPNIGELKHTLDLLNQSSMLDSLVPSKTTKKQKNENKDSKIISEIEEKGIKCQKCGHRSTFKDACFCGICAASLRD